MVRGAAVLPAAVLPPGDGRKWLHDARRAVGPRAALLPKRRGALRGQLRRVAVARAAAHGRAAGRGPARPVRRRAGQCRPLRPPAAAAGQPDGRAGGAGGALGRGGRGEPRRAVRAAQAATNDPRRLFRAPRRRRALRAAVLDRRADVPRDGRSRCGSGRRRRRRARRRPAAALRGGRDAPPRARAPRRLRGAALRAHALPGRRGAPLPRVVGDAPVERGRAPRRGRGAASPVRVRARLGDRPRRLRARERRGFLRGRAPRLDPVARRARWRPARLEDRYQAA